MENQWFLWAASVYGDLWKHDFVFMLKNNDFFNEIRMKIIDFATFFCFIYISWTMKTMILNANIWILIEKTIIFARFFMIMNIRRFLKRFFSSRNIDFCMKNDDFWMKKINVSCAFFHGIYLVPRNMKITFFT